MQLSGNATRIEKLFYLLTWIRVNISIRASDNRFLYDLIEKVQQKRRLARINKLITKDELGESEKNKLHALVLLQENIISIVEKRFKEYEHSSEKCLTYEPETMSIKEALELASALHVAAFDCLACDIESAGYLEDLLVTGKRALEAGDHTTFYFGEEMNDRKQ